MKAYIVRSNKKIEPFGEHPGDCLITNRTLKGIQEETLLTAGLEPISISNESEIVDDNEYILLTDSLYFSLELVSEFINSSRKRKSATVCALKSGITTLRTAINLQEVTVRDGYVEYQLNYFPKREDRIDGVIYPVVISPDEFCAFITMPNHMCDSANYTIPMTDKLIIQIDHWVNLWVANILAILADGARLKKSNKMKLAFLALRSLSFNQWKIMKNLNNIGKNCDIHPTAYIEGSTLGDNVTIGAGSIIRESVLGDGVYIGNDVAIEESVIGHRSTILSGHFLYSVMYPKSFSVTEIVSACLVGRETFMGGKTTLTDFRLDRQNVIVLKEGIRTDTGNRFLGCCLGHGVHLGSGCVIAPGRTVLNKSRLAVRRNIISSFTSENNLRDFRRIEPYTSFGQ